MHDHVVEDGPDLFHLTRVERQLLGQVLQRRFDAELRAPLFLERLHQARTEQAGREAAEENQGKHASCLADRACREALHYRPAPPEYITTASIVLRFRSISQPSRTLQ